MENKEKNIDQILLSKAYNELSAEEFLAIKGEIKSESEYNDLRTMLIAASEEIACAEEIEPRTATKDFLMKEFARVHPATRTSAGGLGFLFPKGRAFYQKPGYQLIAVAAILVLIFTIFPKISTDGTSDNDMAQHKVSEPSPSKNADTKVAETQKEDAEAESSGEMVMEKDLSNEQESMLDQTIAITNPEYKTEKEKNVQLKGTAEGGSKDKVFASDGFSNNNASNEAFMNNPIAEESMDDAVADEKLNTPYESTVMTGASNDLDIANSSNIFGNVNTSDIGDGNGTSNGSGSGFEDSEIAMTSEMESLEEAPANMQTISKTTNKERANKKDDMAPTLVKKSKSLAENAELIDLFYTAM